MGAEIENKFLHSDPLTSHMGAEGIEPPSSGLEPNIIPVYDAPFRIEEGECF